MRRGKAILIGSIMAGAAAGGCLGDLPGTAGRTRGRAADVPVPTPSASAASEAPVPPDFGATVSQPEAPPPISGGTLVVTANGAHGVAADPDRGLVHVVHVGGGGEVITIEMGRHAMPGRVALDGSGRAHVVLRGTGEVLTLALPGAEVLHRRAVCAEPRGIAHDPLVDVIHVACATGELVTLPASGGEPVRVRHLARDLNDVVVTARGLRVTTFREGGIWRVVDEPAPRLAALSSYTGVRPNVAWRMIAAPPPRPGDDDERDGDNDVIVTAQRPQDEVPVAPEYYRSDGRCDSAGPLPLVVDRGWSTVIPPAVLPVDVTAVDGLLVLVAAANGHTRGLPQLVVRRRDAGFARTCDVGEPVHLPGQPTSVASLPGARHRVLVQSREPSALHVVDLSTAFEPHVVSTIALSDESREDTGHAIFHANSGLGVACASCHPDGRDDGHAWSSADVGARRTPSLRATIVGTAPYHWDGAAEDMRAVAEMTFQVRMRGPVLAADQSEALGAWVARLAPLRRAPPPDAAAVARGKALFEGAGGCVACHGGALATNNATVDVGTGGAVQVPSLLGVAFRAPYFHDGSFASVAGVVARGHGGSVLAEAEQVDLVSYVESL